MVRVGGQQKPAVRIQIDPAKLVEKNLQLEDIASSDRPGHGRQRQRVDHRRQAVVHHLRQRPAHQRAKPWKDVIVAYRNGAPVRVRDIGEAVDGPLDRLQRAWSNGKPSVFLVVFKQPGANVIKTVQSIKDTLVKLELAIPPRHSRVACSPTAPPPSAPRSQDVQFTLLLTIGLVVMVIFVFLRSFWATVIPSITVPLALLGSAALMYGRELQPRQPVADGAHHRGRLRRRRRDRDAREHLPPHRGGHEAVRGGAQGRGRDRLHHRLDHDLAGRGVHPAAC